MSMRQRAASRRLRRAGVRTILAWFLVAVFLLIPLITALVCTDGWLIGRPRKIFGENLVGTTSLHVHARADSVVADYNYGWRGTPPQRWNKYPVPGVIISKNVIVVNDPFSDRGDVIIAMWFRWPLVIAINALLMIAAIVVAARTCVGATDPVFVGCAAMTSALRPIGVQNAELQWQVQHDQSGPRDELPFISATQGTTDENGADPSRAWLNTGRACTSPT